MSTVSTRAAQRPNDGYLPRYLRTAAPLEWMDPAFARAAEEPVGHPHRAGLLSASVRAVNVPAVDQAAADELRKHMREAPQIGIRPETVLEVPAHHS
ncbi:hypothetical protein [Rhodococcus koreensis]|uniref:hypothetical protein n=1 Tax=Rhodococcus koreensis TaxID=99653 RepID=UPI00366B11CF